MPSPLLLNTLPTADELRSIVDEATTVVDALGRQVDRARKADELRAEIVSNVAMVKALIAQIDLKQRRRHWLLSNINVFNTEESGAEKEAEGEGEGEGGGEGEGARARARDNEAGARALVEDEAERLLAIAIAEARATEKEQMLKRRSENLAKRDAQLNAQMNIQTEFDSDLQDRRDNIAKRDKKRKLEVFDMIHFSAVRAATHLALTSNVDYMRMFFYNT